MNFDALELVAAMCSCVPETSKRIVRCFGYYSNVSRGKRKSEQADEMAFFIFGPDRRVALWLLRRFTGLAVKRSKRALPYRGANFP